MKILKLFLLGYIILIAGCTKSTKNNDDIVTIASGSYQTSSTVTHTQPVMYVYDTPITDENIIKNYLSRKNLLDSFVFDKSEEQFSSVIKLNFQKPIIFKYEKTGQLVNDTNELTGSVNVSNTISKIKLFNLETGHTYPSLDINPPLRTVMQFLNTDDSIQVKNLPQGSCYFDIALFRGVSNYVIFDPNNGYIPDTVGINPNAYAYKSFPVLYQNDSILLPLITWTVSSQNGSCQLYSKDEWNFSILNIMPANSQSDTIVIQQAYLQLIKQP